jgi:hypothetical protein
MHNIYVYICIHIHTFTQIYIYIYIYTHTHSHTCMYIHVIWVSMILFDSSLSVRRSLGTSMHGCMDISYRSWRGSRSSCWCRCLRVYICICICMCMCTGIFIGEWLCCSQRVHEHWFVAATHGCLRWGRCRCLQHGGHGHYSKQIPLCVHWHQQNTLCFTTGHVPRAVQTCETPHTRKPCTYLHNSQISLSTEPRGQ